MLKIFSAQTNLGSSNFGTEKAPVFLSSELKKSFQFNRFEASFIKPIKNRKLSAKKDQWPHNYEEIIDFNHRLYRSIINNSKPTDLVITLGGDHSVSLGSLFATKLRFEEAVIVYIDAHPDCTNPTNSISGNIHGMQLATVLGDSLYTNFNYPKYDYKEVFLMGIKDIDPAEEEYLLKNHILNIKMDEIIELGIASALEKIVQHIQNRPVHVSLDIDSIDVLEAPGTGIINKGGFTYREISYLCRHLADQNIVAIDLVEVNPDRDINRKTIGLGVELVTNLVRGKWSPYLQYMQDIQARTSSQH